MRKDVKYYIIPALVVLIPILGFLHMYSGRPVRAAGEIVRRSFDVGDFTELQITGSYMVIYRVADEASVVIEAYESLFDHLVVFVHDNMLRVESRRGRRIDTGGSARPRVYVYAPYLVAVYFYGASHASGWDTIRTRDFSILQQCVSYLSLPFANIAVSLEVENVYIGLYGPANLTLYGTADTADISLMGNGMVDAHALQTRDAIVSMESNHGIVFVAASDNLDILSIGWDDGHGRLYYVGDPVITSQIY